MRVDMGIRLDKIINSEPAGICASKGLSGIITPAKVLCVVCGTEFLPEYEMSRFCTDMCIEKYFEERYEKSERARIAKLAWRKTK